MMFLLFGSSAAGKSAALEGVRARMPDLATHDFDEIGVPSDANPAWRQRTNERWVRRALDYQRLGHDLLLAGQTPLGELLATPSASALEGVSACLLDCEDDVRVQRIQGRGRDWLERAPGELQDHLLWAEWMRRHARNPRWRQDVIRAPGAAEMRWERWTEWREDDPRWRVHVIDTSTLPVDGVADELTRWVQDERELLRSGRHPLGAVALRHLDMASAQNPATRD